MQKNLRPSPGEFETGSELRSMIAARDDMADERDTLAVGSKRRRALDEMIEKLDIEIGWRQPL